MKILNLCLQLLNITRLLAYQKNSICQNLKIIDIGCSNNCVHRVISKRWFFKLPLLLFVLILIFSSCSKKNDCVNFSIIVDGLSNLKDSAEFQKYYTADTVNLINKAVEKGIISKDCWPNILPQFSKNIRMEEIYKECKNGLAKMQVKYIDHPSENMIGFKMTLNFIKENSVWKIDFKKELLVVLDIKSKNLESEYLKNLRSY